MFDLLISSAQAQGAAQGPQNPLVSFVPFIIIFFIFYFFMLRPQKRRMQEEKLLLASLSKGDEIYTKSGILGTIVGLTDKVITLEVSEGSKLKVLREHVGGLAKGIFEKRVAEKR